MDERTTDPPPAGASAPQIPVPRTGDDGKPVYDQEFFLALARCGAQDWNRWRQEHSDVPVTLKGVDFRLAGGQKPVCFAGFRFGNHADLSGAVFGNEANLSCATFGTAANLSRARFGNGASLSGVTFGPRAKLSKVHFGSGANLSAAVFFDGCDISESVFGRGVNLSWSTFRHGAKFSSCIFGPTANLRGTVFGYGADFNRATFLGDVDLGASSSETWKGSRERLITNSEALRSLSQESKEKIVNIVDWTKEIEGSGPEAFLNINFSKARFLGSAIFSRRKFVGLADMTGTRFYQPPSFRNCEELSHLNLYGAKISFAGRLALNWNQQISQTWFYVWRLARFGRKGLAGIKPRGARRRVRWLERAVIHTRGWSTDSNVANRLRRLRGLAETTNNHDLERDLYIEERKAERGVLLAQYWFDAWSIRVKPKFYNHCLWIAAIAAYSILADYGRSFVRPLVALAVSVPLLWWAYTAVLIPSTDPTKLSHFRRATWAFAISNAVPFVGALTLERDVKLTLLCGDWPIDAQQAQASGQPLCVPIPGRRFQLLALGQSIFSALCIFFVGLALRNYFKLG